MDTNILLQDALQRAREHDKSMYFSDFQYDGIINKIEVIFLGHKNGKIITTSNYIDITCNSSEEAESFKQKYPEYLI